VSEHKTQKKHWLCLGQCLRPADNSRQEVTVQQISRHVRLPPSPLPRRPGFLLWYLLVVKTSAIFAEWLLAGIHLKGPWRLPSLGDPAQRNAHARRKRRVSQPDPLRPAPSVRHSRKHAPERLCGHRESRDGLSQALAPFPRQRTL
jgi:hypothetical protein